MSNFSFMKNSTTYFLLFCTFLLTTSTQAQNKYDYQWVFGQRPGIRFDFNQNPVKIDTLNLSRVFSSANAGICNEEGELQFYSNRCYINNHEHELMENGDSISLDSLLGFCGTDGMSGANVVTQTILALPVPDHPDEYLLFYHGLRLVQIDSQWIFIPTLLFSAQVDMRINNGLGAAVSKNDTLLNAPMAVGYIQAVQHANGNDWWIMIPEYASNCYFRFLLTSEGLIGPFKQCIGIPWDSRDQSGQAVFSPDGNRYARYNPFNGLHLFDFDRCRGLLSNHQFFEPIVVDSSYSGGTGLAFSPNSQFLYVMTTLEVFQYDTQASDIENSKIQVGEYDGFANPWPVIYAFSMLAPDDKIYIAAGSSTYNLSVINQPDSAGLACGFVPHGIDLPTFNFVGLPNFPHFRTGVSSEVCDTLFTTTTAIFQEEVLEVWPNPASQRVNVRFESFQAAARIEIFDLHGRLVKTAILSKSTSEINLMKLNGGMYFYRIHRERKLVKTGKIILTN